MSLIKALDHLSYDKKLRETGLFRLEKRMLMGISSI